MPDQYGCDPFALVMLHRAREQLRCEADELAAALRWARSLCHDTDWKSAAADGFHVSAVALADDLSWLSASVAALTDSVAGSAAAQANAWTC